MKKNDNIKTFLLGFIATLLVVFLISAKGYYNEETANIGRYRAKITESDILILDTSTGEYIYRSGDYEIFSSENKFKKSSFQEKFEKSKPH